MKATALREVLDEFIRKSDHPDDLEVFNEATGIEIQKIKLELQVDSNEMSEEKITIS
jgi:hypothetical protein